MKGLYDENYDSVYEGNSRAYEEFWKGLEAEVENESKVQSEVLVTIREKVTIEFGNDILKNDFARFQDQNRKEIE